MFTPDKVHTSCEQLFLFRNLWRLPEPRLQAVLVDTVERAMTQWPALIESLPFTDAQRGKLLAHLEANASVAAWRRRAARRKPASAEGA